MDGVDWSILGAVFVLSAIFLYYSFRDTKGSASRANPSKYSLPVSTSENEVKSEIHPKKKSIISLITKAEHPIFILFYGTQTGTATELAGRLATELVDGYGVHALTCDIEDYRMEELVSLKDLLPGASKASAHRFGIAFLVATYGEGEPTDNAAEFYHWIMDGSTSPNSAEGDEDDAMVEAQMCSGVPYMVFGLGNKTYEHYNVIGKRLFKRMAKLGGSPLCPLGLGDANESLEDDFLAWKPNALAEVAKLFGLSTKPISALSLRGTPHISLFTLKVTAEPPSDEYFRGELSARGPRAWDPEGREIARPGGMDAKHPFYAKVVSASPLFTDTVDEFSVCGTRVPVERKCFHIEFDLQDSLKYQTGDHVGVWPSNSASEISGLLSVLGAQGLANQFISLVPNPANPRHISAKLPFAMPCTLNTALSYYLDLQTHIKQHHVEILAKYAQDPEEKAAIFRVLDDRSSFIQCVEKSHKNLREILEEFPSINVPLEVVLGELLSCAAVRYYSISSSSKAFPSKISVTAVVVRYVLESHSFLSFSDTSNIGNDGKKIVAKEGLATSWLQRLAEAQASGSQSVNHKHPSHIPPMYIPLYIRKSNFKLPINPGVPVVMIGPGTGVAPFRAFLQERRRDAKAGLVVGPTWLFYGCRRSDQDYLYREEFEAFEREFPFIRIITAFSRQPGQAKVYVQHRLAEHGEAVFEMIHRKRGYFYVCGDAKRMAHDVQMTLTSLAMRYGGQRLENEERAKDWVRDLRGRGRYLEDVWS